MKSLKTWPRSTPTADAGTPSADECSQLRQRAAQIEQAAEAELRILAVRQKLLEARAGVEAATQRLNLQSATAPSSSAAVDPGVVAAHLKYAERFPGLAELVVAAYELAREMRDPVDHRSTSRGRQSQQTAASPEPGTELTDSDITTIAALGLVRCYERGPARFDEELEIWKGELIDRYGQNGGSEIFQLALKLRNARK